MRVVRGRVVFGVVIGEIVGTFVPIEPELALGFPASEPMDLHANHFDAACDDGVVYESDCSQIVCLDRVGCELCVEHGCHVLWGIRVHL